MRVVKEWPRLEAETRIGKTKYWIIRVFEESGVTFTETEYWQDEGIHQTASKKVEGKNIGRANQTSPLMQALLEAEADWKKQKDKGYLEAGEQKSSPYILPMLAHDFKKRGHNITWPCYGQPKLDGFRALYHPDHGFWSRQGKPFGNVVDLSHLYFDTGGFIIDGELILPRPCTFQQTCSAIKKQCALTPLLEYHIFDIVSDEDYSGRRNRVVNLWLKDMPPLSRQVPSNRLRDEEEARELLSKYIEQGYEGLILRNNTGKYIIGQRSADLQKYKEFEDAEYLVVEITEGTGREEGAAILICETPEGKAFNVRPKGDYDFRRKMFQSRDVIGKYYTVRYQNLSDENIPRFPVGIAVREDWDR